MGAGPLAEIFVIAFRLPNLFRRLFAEGALTPPLCRSLQRASRTKARLPLCRSDIFSCWPPGLHLLAKFSCLLWCLLWRRLAGDGEEFALAVHYARISFPYLIFMSLMALFAAMLNAVNRFAAALRPYCSIWCLLGRWLWRRLTGCRWAIDVCSIM